MGLREARRRAKLSQKDLERLSGIEQPMISRIETGRVVNPSFDTVLKLAAALDLDPRRLKFGEAA